MSPLLSAPRGVGWILLWRIGWISTSIMLIHSLASTRSSSTTSAAWAWTSPARLSGRYDQLFDGPFESPVRRLRLFQTGAATNTNNNPDDADDNADEDLFRNLPSSASASSSSSPPHPKKLGIDIGAQLAPLSASEAAELSAAAREIVNDAVAAGLDDLTALRDQWQADVHAARDESQRVRDLQTQRATTEWQNKVDALTESFLQTTQSERTATQRAAAADRAAAGRGLEVGVWGTIDGVAVTTMNRDETVATGLGRVADVAASEDEEEDTQPPPRLLILADIDADPYARTLVPAVTAALPQVLASQPPEVQVYKPTATVPLGGNNADAVVVFSTSFTDSSTVANALERVLRRTLSSSTGRVGTPPTHILLVSTVGTSQTHRMPYSLQNLWSGGALEKRRQMEETVIRMVRDRDPQLPPLDYTICKLGELQTATGKTNEFALRPGDEEMEGGGTTLLDVTTAATVVTQALALQPFARNATFTCVGQLLSSTGSSSTTSEQQQQQAILDDAFLRLDGPELWRLELANNAGEEQFGALVEYVREWAQLLANNNNQNEGRRLATPIQAQDVTTAIGNTCPTVVRRQQSAVRVLFLPTNTGNRYRSKEEERERERSSSDSSASSSSGVSARRAIMAKEGGVEFVVEELRTPENRLRVRAKRCNYGDDTVLKELSEKTILSRFRQCMEVWQKDHAAQ